MERSVSPLHVHVGRKTPVHVHLKRKGLSKAERLEISCSEMSAGRPSLRASVSKNRGSHWGSGSTNRSPWVPPPARSSSSNRMMWEGPTHRLEITPGVNGEGAESTVLRVSDLSDQGIGLTDIVVEREPPIENKLQSLRAEVNELKNEVDLERSLRDLEDTECALRESRMSLREREEELARCKEDLMDREIENVRLSLEKVKGHSSNIRPSTASAESRQREKLTKKMLEMEMDSTTLCKQADRFREAIRKLQKDRRFLSVYASDVAEQKDVLLEQLAQFECSNKSLRKMLRAQQVQESNIGKLSEHREVLLKQVSEAETTNHLLRSRLDESEKIAMHSQTLHDELGQREGEIQGLNIRIQSLDELLRTRDNECVRLESSMVEQRHKSQLDKDLLKKATKQHKERAVESEQTVGTMGAQLELANAELDDLRSKLAKSTREEITYQAEIRSLKSKVKELQETLDLSKVTSKSSVNAVSARLLEKTQELNSAQMENDRLQSTISTLEGRIKAIETTAHAKKSTMESEIAQLQSSVKQYESMILEYRGQIEGGRLDVEEKSRELRYKDDEVERTRQEGAIQLEKTKIVYQQQISELESTKDLLKTTEARLKDTQERLLSYEQRAVDQTRLMAELNGKLDHTNTSMDTVRDKWHESTGENRSMAARLEVQERRIQDTEQQNRELMELAAKKEDAIQRLQGRVEELLREVSSVTSQAGLTKSDYKRQNEQIKDRAASKDRANLSRIADLETQLSRANTVSSQLRKVKEDSERRYQSKVHELQDRLEQANSTKRSMENYANFLKSSYASVFNDVSGSPGSHINPLIH